MTDEDLALALYRRIIEEQEDRIASLEKALRDVTYVNGNSVHVAHKEFVDLADRDPIFHDVHSMI